MELKHTIIDGLYIIDQSFSTDNRGTFVKNFQHSFFKMNGLDYKFDESFYTESKKNVIRGMHFQVPPFDHSKLITVISGRILDVVLDIRRNSKTYGKHFTIELSRDNKKSLYIPKGLAHGFAVLSEIAIAYYQVTSEYSQNFDQGIHFNSFGFDWPIQEPIISIRDQNFPHFNEFNSPFKK